MQDTVVITSKCGSRGGPWEGALEERDASQGFLLRYNVSCPCFPRSLLLLFIFVHTSFYPVPHPNTGKQWLTGPANRLASLQGSPCSCVLRVGRAARRRTPPYHLLCGVPFDDSADGPRWPDVRTLPPTEPRPRCGTWGETQVFGSLSPAVGS